MWITTNKGMLSAVKDRNSKEKRFVLRARNKEPLAEFGGRIVETKDSDYRFRVFLSDEEYKMFLMDLADDVDYDNFKNSIKDKRLKTACNEIWWSGMKMQNDKYGKQVGW